jgi:hypothetical protein
MIKKSSVGGDCEPFDALTNEIRITAPRKKDHIGWITTSALNFLGNSRNCREEGYQASNILMDRLSHGTMSLLHPCLATSQGSSLVVCLHDVSMKVEDIVRMTSPAKYYSSTISGGGGCLQVLTGKNSLLIFDLTGNYLIEDKVQEEVTCTSSLNEINAVRGVLRRKEKANTGTKNYGLSHSFSMQFSNQFEPFLSLSAGVEVSLSKEDDAGGENYFCGTIIRMPLRKHNGPPFPICDRSFLRI